MRLLRWITALSVMLLMVGSVATVKAQAVSPAKPEKTLQQWRDDRARGLQQPEGWLSLVGLEWLHEGVNTVGSAADNSLHLPAGAPAHLAAIKQTGTGESAKLEISAPKDGFPAGLTIDDAAAHAGDLTQSAKLKVGTYVVLIILRGEKLGLRVKDANAPTRVNFHGLNWYAPNAAYRVKAKWIPYLPEHDVTVPTIIGTLSREKTPGVAEFVLNGKTLRLEPIIEEEGELFFILRDTTSRTTTYGAARFLYTGLPSNGLKQPGELVMDFNRLQNPPCAYTAYATCPLPWARNRLNVAIPAGEKRYHD